MREDERIEGGRRSRVVLMPRRWHQVGDDVFHHADDGDKKARSPERARRKPLKPFARAKPDYRIEPAVTLLVCFFVSRTRLRVRNGIRLSLRPLF